LRPHRHGPETRGTDVHAEALEGFSWEDFCERNQYDLVAN
jgi:hypothetical protein